MKGNSYRRKNYWVGWCTYNKKNAHKRVRKMNKNLCKMTIDK